MTGALTLLGMVTVLLLAPEVLSLVLDDLNARCAIALVSFTSKTNDIVNRRWKRVVWSYFRATGNLLQVTSEYVYSCCCQASDGPLSPVPGHFQ
ncbi:hypothetical protein BDV30DRAFT_187717 [Aspergillus minisclerotigenes]|uniref:Secreted protein n=1 Tax=Aspergillus minisclerotigenes TaxID=656917 RepID=A0A5N6ISA3_9EURO|nr:hypothetical protein BDV30DRAFT_187717 [Aspergillus minisclerotigenes]